MEQNQVPRVLKNLHNHTSRPSIANENVDMVTHFEEELSSHGKRWRRSHIDQIDHLLKGLVTINIVRNVDVPFGGFESFVLDVDEGVVELGHGRRSEYRGRKVWAGGAMAGLGHLNLITLLDEIRS